MNTIYGNVKKRAGSMSLFAISLICLLFFFNVAMCEDLKDINVFSGDYTFVNQKKADDNPWGFNAGIISADNGDDCVFLTPNTAVILYNLKERTLDFLVGIHPLVSDVSDGAGLLIWLLDKDENILYDEYILISSGSDFQEVMIDFSQYVQTASIRIICNNGGNNNDNGDWVIIKNNNTSTGEHAWGKYRVTFVNAQATTDNPWKFTAGVINSETDGNCIFLTPETVAHIYCIKEEQIEFELSIHPWVAQFSDGVNVICDLLDLNSKLVYKQNFFINSIERQKIIIQLDQFPQCSQIVFQCDSGNKGNANADWLIIKQINTQESKFGLNGYVKSATYFGDEWPINFWNSEKDHLEEDLQRIKDDGFNSIILVIPWKEFQCGINPIKYNDYAFKQLDRVMNAATNIGLNVYTRIGYTWDYWNDIEESIFDRYIGLFKYDSVREAWMDYARHLFTDLCKYSCFSGAFLTWEDFWNVLSVCDIGDEKTRIENAYLMGYQEWLADHYTLVEYNDNYSVNYAGFDQVPFPHRNAPAMESVYRYYDECLNELLRQTQDVFPNLSNEVRLDADIVYDKEGNLQYYSHKATFGCENSDYTATMYGIPMGFENVGERVSAAEAIRKTEYILNLLLTQNEGKPIYVEQFLFCDNTPNFAHNAQIIKDEVDDYLNLVADVLLEYTAGYGIWTYRDYRNNMIYNNGFGLQGLGWELQNNVEFELENGSMVAHLKIGEGLSQCIMGIRNHFDSDSYIVSFDVAHCYTPGIASVRMGESTEDVNITREGKYILSFPRNSSFDFAFINNSGEYSIDNICLFSFIQQGFLYDQDNQELEFIDCVRSLNRELEGKDTQAVFDDANPIRILAN